VKQLYLQRNFQKLRWKLDFHLILVGVDFNERLYERRLRQQNQTVTNVVLCKGQVVVGMDARYLFVHMPDSKLYHGIFVQLNVFQDIWEELIKRNAIETFAVVNSGRS